MYYFLTFLGLAIASIHYWIFIPILFGFLTFHFIHKVSKKMVDLQFSERSANAISFSLLFLFIVSLLGLIVLGAVHLSHTEGGFVNVTLDKFYQSLEPYKAWLPSFAIMPNDVAELKKILLDFSKEHFSSIQTILKEFGHEFAHILICMVIGGMAAVHKVGGQFDRFSKEHSSTNC